MCKCLNYSVFILAVISLWSSRQECSFLSLLAVVENPLQVQLHCPQMNYSSRMRSMKCSGLHTCPRTCLMIQNHNKYSSNKLLSPLHLLDLTSHARSTQSTHNTGKCFLRVCTQKCDALDDSSSGMAWIPPFVLLPNEDSTVNTEFSCISPDFN